MVDLAPMKRRSWCFDNNIKIYPVPSRETYTVVKMVNGRKRKVTIPTCTVEVNLGGMKKRGTELWEQDEEMEVYIQQLYDYYYERANN
jgi:hypothetical protein